MIVPASNIPLKLDSSTASAATFPDVRATGAESFSGRESLRSFAYTTVWVAGFLGGGYLLLWKPLIDRWLF